IALKINYKEVYKRREVLQKARQEQEAQEKAEQERQEKEEKAAKRRQYDDCCKNADNLFKQERWGQAKEQYKAAQGMYEAGYTPKADALQIKIERCDDEIAARDYIDHAKTYLQDQKYEKAAVSLQNALKEKASLKERPDIQTLQQQIQDGIVAERERKAHEEAERKAREEAERKAHEEAKIRQLPVPIQQLLQDMVLVEGGSFMMGSDDGRDSEKPVHRVSFDSFYIAKYPVTQAQWIAVMGSNPSYFKGNNLPVEQVNWQDVQDCVAKLNAMLQKAELPAGFCLPTEAQWEYAARGGNKSKSYKYAGSDDIDKVAWYNGNSSNQTQPVGQKEANELGLYDMTGNVWEWCQDEWYDNYKGAPADGSVWEKKENNGLRVVRGGSWNANPNYCRVSVRSYDLDRYPVNIMGWRLSRC
ncbi:MAG TPA: formylglycine-generating enzyme family protein, partial [Chitinophagales bacterium]|nr:formylglycine-generating enzyme family protein [Chitinophagales bacterium]